MTSPPPKPPHLSLPEKNTPAAEADVILTKIKYHSQSNRTRSVSSSSSSSLSSLSTAEAAAAELHSPTTPLDFPGRIPFSWEHQPGVPKYLLQPSRSSRGGLPLPPLIPSLQRSSVNRFGAYFEGFFIIDTIRKKVKVREDPFFRAFVECSKDHPQISESSGSSWNNKTPATAASGKKLGSNKISASCKSSCTVVESQVLIPRSSRNNPYRLLVNRSNS